MSEAEVSMLSEAEVIGLRRETRAWIRGIRRCMIDLANNLIAKPLTHAQHIASPPAALPQRPPRDRRTALLNR